MERYIVRKIHLSCFLTLAFSIASLGQNPSVATQSARAVPDFLNRSVIYQVWMRSFTPEGTLSATATHLSYIADLGATIVYLSPLNVHGYPSVFGPSTPYEIKDYDVIDPEYGTEADLKSLVEQAHKLGLKVIMDIVYAHSANDNVLLNRLGFYQRTPDGKLIMSRWKTPMPDFTNPQVHEYFCNNMLHWVRDVGIDGFRADVAGGVPLAFWEEARDAMNKVNPNVIMLAEADAPEQQLKAFDISYNFPYYSALTAVVVNGESAERIQQQWEKVKATLPRGARVLHLNDNHDRNRVDVVMGEKAAIATTVLNFTLDGIPFLYNGQAARLQTDRSNASRGGGAHLRRAHLDQEQQPGRSGQLHSEEGQRRGPGAREPDQPHHESAGGRGGVGLRSSPGPAEKSAAARLARSRQIQLPVSSV
jgi:glycosidase